MIMVELIYIPCKEVEKNKKINFWMRTIKIYFKNPKINGIDILKGLRPFILSIHKTHTMAKVINVMTQ